MDSLIWVALITGLTTGGISCMAVQGGLLTTSLDSQIESNVVVSGIGKKKGTQPPAKSPQLTRSIVLFLIAKTFAYTLLGFVLGGLGSVLGLTPLTRGILQILVAGFMIGNGLRMLNVHPIFRYFNFETPAPIRRYLRTKSKGSASAFTPLFLGFLTVLIPCGVTQSMMAVAVGTGDPWMGAVIMLSFTLGTSSVFFGLMYLATHLGALMGKWFVRIVAAALLILGLVSLDAGLNLVGSPLTLTRVAGSIENFFVFGTADSGLTTFDPAGSTNLGQPSGQAVNGVLELRVTNQGYVPTLLKAPAGEAIKLNLVTSKTYSCARAFTIPSLGISVLAPETGTVSVDIPPQKAGSRLGFTCSMGMYSGEIVFD